MSLTLLFFVQFSVNAPKGTTTYTLVVSQYRKSRDVRFTLAVFSAEPCYFGKLPDPWIEQCSVSHRDVTVPKYANPRIRIRVLNQCELLLKLQVEKDRFVFIEVKEVVGSASSRKGDSEVYRDGFCYAILKHVPSSHYEITLRQHQSVWNGVFILNICATIPNNVVLE